MRKHLMIGAAASCGILSALVYPVVKSVYSIKKQPLIEDDYVDPPTATADLTKDIVIPESVGTGIDVPIDVSHWLLLSNLKSNDPTRRERALNVLASERRWNDAECCEIAQALDKQDIVRLARTPDADIRLFLRPPSVEFIKATLGSNKIEKLIRDILKDVSETSNDCSSCATFYTSLSIRVRPDPNVLAMSDLNQVDKAMHRRKRSDYSEDNIKLKAILNNVMCGETQARLMAESGLLLALLYFRHKYSDDIQVNSLLAQIIANLSTHKSSKDFIFTDGWIQTLVHYSRSEYLELSLPAHKALANLDSDLDVVYGNHVYLLSPAIRNHENSEFDVIFVHGLVGSVFKSWRQGRIILDKDGHRLGVKNYTPTTELLPSSLPDTSDAPVSQIQELEKPYTRCWPKDWLSNDIKGLRILAIDYPTALSNWRTECDTNKDSLKQRATHVIRQLEAARVGEKPIIWVAHSMGGLLVKQILVICDEYLNANATSKTLAGDNERENKDACLFRQPKSSQPAASETFRNLLNQTKGIVFYSVPHKGSNLDWIERRNLQKLLMLTTEVIELQKGSRQLLELHQNFLSLINRSSDDVQFMTFAEDSVSSFGVNKVVQWRGVLVHEDSLRFEVGPVYVLNIDHAHTCKPHNREAITYAKTRDFISELMPSDKKHRDEDLMPFIAFFG